MVVILHISVIKLILKKMPHKLMAQNKPWRIFLKLDQLIP